jgi:hypothetical protein
MMPDLNLLDLEKEIIEVGEGASAEEFFAVPIPDDGEHLAHLVLGNRGIQVKRQADKNNGGQRTGPAFVDVHVQAKIVNPDTGEEGMSTFDNVNSVIMASGMSRLHALLDLAGAPAPRRCTVPELQAHVEQAFAQTLTVGVVTAWEAQEKVGSTYETVLKGQKKFPAILDAEGNPVPGKFSPEVVNPKTGNTVRAQARIVKYSRPKA